jgi:hypothetical protein
MAKVKRTRGLSRLRPTVLRTGFLIEASRLALERWDRLSEKEQRRYRKLATAARGDPDGNLSREDRKELLQLWKRFEARKLISSVLRGSRRQDSGAEDAESPAIGS